MLSCRLFATARVRPASRRRLSTVSRVLCPVQYLFGEIPHHARAIGSATSNPSNDLGGIAMLLPSPGRQSLWQWFALVGVRWQIA